MCGGCSWGGLRAGRRPTKEPQGPPRQYKRKKFSFSFESPPVGQRPTKPTVQAVSRCRSSSRLRVQIGRVCVCRKTQHTRFPKLSQGLTMRTDSHCGRPARPLFSIQVELGPERLFGICRWSCLRIIRGRTRMTEKQRILIICQHNSGRSQIADGLSEAICRRSARN